MSLRSAFRSKFRGDKEKEPVVKESAEPKENNESIRYWKSLDEEDYTRYLPPEDGEAEQEKPSEKEPTGTENGNGFPAAEVTNLFRDTDEKAVYEMQLTQLQEQLVAAMIENQQLSRELHQYKEKNQLDKLLYELEQAKETNKLLSEQLTEAKQSRKKTRPSRPDTGADGDMGSDWVDVAQEALEEDESAALVKQKQLSTFREQVREYFFSLFYELMADFTEEPEPEPQEEGEGDPLTVKRLKENIKRFRGGTKPIFATIRGIHGILSWKNVSLTLIVFCVYMYSVWHGWLLPVVLFLVIFRLFVNYLKHRGWSVNIHYFSDPEDSDHKDEAFRDLGMSDKFNLVLQVARQVQNFLGKVADSLEKIKNLLMWETPQATSKLFGTLCMAFLLSCLLPGTTLFLLGALYMGVKLFIINYVYNRFPRFKHRHDTTYKTWKMLPTDAELEKRYLRATIDRSVVPRNLYEEEYIDRQTSLEQASSDSKSFCELFSLPRSESPLSGWHGGKRCTLINKDKSLTAAFKHGKLFLTRSFLCFERSKSPSPKNLVIALSDVVKLEKAKPYAWMPGGGMSIEVTVTNQDRPYLFGALLSRDDCFENIMAHGIKYTFPWAAPVSSPKSPTSPVASSSPATTGKVSVSHGSKNSENTDT